MADDTPLLSQSITNFQVLKDLADVGIFTQKDWNQFVRSPAFKIMKRDYIQECVTEMEEKLAAAEAEVVDIVQKQSDRV